jgi:hypothetical protein
MKPLIGAAVFSLILGYSFGRYGHPVKVTETKVVQVEVEREDRSQIIKVETVKPDGTKIIKTRTKKNVITETDKRSETTKVVENRAGLNIAALVGVHGGSAVYGASVTRTIIGPITAGAFLLTTGTAGVSVGLQF